MIGYLNGTVLDMDQGVVTLAVAGGSIGYSVRVPENSRSATIAPGNKIELFIYTHVREDALDLFGFFTLEEKKCFLALTSVNGIGPKLGMTLISNLSVSEIIGAIVTGNRELLTAIPGVGKKTVERMILELQEKFKKSDFIPSSAPKMQNSSIKSEVAAILASLGYRTVETDRVIAQALSDNPKDAENVEAIIQSALKLISKKTNRNEVQP